MISSLTHVMNMIMVFGGALLIGRMVGLWNVSWTNAAQNGYWLMATGIWLSFKMKHFKKKQIKTRKRGIWFSFMKLFKMKQIKPRKRYGWEVVKFLVTLLSNSVIRVICVGLEDEMRDRIRKIFQAKDEKDSFNWLPKILEEIRQRYKESYESLRGLVRPMEKVCVFGYCPLGHLAAFTNLRHIALYMTTLALRAIRTFSNSVDMRFTASRLLQWRHMYRILYLRRSQALRCPAG